MSYLIVLGTSGNNDIDPRIEKVFNTGKIKTEVNMTMIFGNDGDSYFVDIGTRSANGRKLNDDRILTIKFDRYQARQLVDFLSSELKYEE